MATPKKNVQRAAERASKAGWYVMAAEILVAVNPDDSSEIWGFFHAENIWKRKGERSVENLRSLWDEMYDNAPADPMTDEQIDEAVDFATGKST